MESALGAAAVIAAAAALVIAPLGAAGMDVTHVTGSRATFVHHLPLLDAENGAIAPDDDPCMPFVYNNTCTKCHEYDLIRKGWHFNATDPKADPGRPGQPWFWCDPKTGTVLPLSYRNWPNTWRPSDVGMSSWQFCLNFGHHLPGGGPGEMADLKDPAAKWLVAGKLGVNCGACHDGSAAYDPIEWYLQIATQNFMWAAAASTDFAAVTGAAASMPASYDPFMGPDDEKQAKDAPAVIYDATRFNAKGEVFFDLPAQPPDNRCYFCHSYTEVGDGAPEPWATDADVHLLSGLTCSDCHRNGLDHMVTRNYEGEPLGKEHPELASLTCRGCHLGDQSAACGPDTMGGRLGAPVPTHLGLPTIHLEKLACTTCHSGLYPGQTTRRVQTSRAHLIEFQGPHRGPDALPHIVDPVFVRCKEDGIIGPRRMVWPAFWCRIEKSDKADAPEKITPLGPDAAYELAKDAFDKKIEGEEEGGLTVRRVLAVLAMLKEKDKAKDEFGYVCAGKLYRANADGALDAADHPAAKPAAWPIGHNVRPATQSLGMGGCTDCHGFDAPVAFGEVEVPSPAEIGQGVTMAMYEFQGRDSLELKAWAMSYLFRPMFKVVGFTTAGVIAAILLLYVLLGLAALVRWAGKKAPPGPA
jgi:hypothetical protein